MKQKLALSMTAAFAAVALTACGSDDSTNESDSSESSSASESASAEESEASDESTEVEESEDSSEVAGGASDADLTPAGEELSIGDTATVTDGDLVVKLTVTEITKGTTAQLKKLQMKEDPKQFAPFYVKVTGEAVSGDVADYDPANDLTGMVGEQPATHLIEFSTFEPCNGERFEDEVKPGDTLDSCTIQLAKKGETVDAVMFDASNTDYDHFDGKPLFWR